MARKKARTKKAKARKPARKTRPAAKKNTTARAERKLDEGLRESFPASDPPAQTDPTRSIRE